MSHDLNQISTNQKKFKVKKAAIIYEDSKNAKIIIKIQQEVVVILGPYFSKILVNRKDNFHPLLLFFKDWQLI